MSEPSAGGQRGLRTFGEQAVFASPEVQLGRVGVGLPGNERIWRHVVHLHRVVSMVLLDDLDRVLLLWRHRSMPDRWGWELPGGFVGQDEEPSGAAARELEDQTGYRAVHTEHLIAYQPLADSVDSEHLVFLGRVAERAGDPGRLEGIDRADWVPLTSVRGLIAAGEIWNGGSLVGLHEVLAQEQ